MDEHEIATIEAFGQCDYSLLRTIAQETLNCIRDICDGGNAAVRVLMNIFNCDIGEDRFSAKTGGLEEPSRDGSLKARVYDLNRRIREWHQAGGKEPFAIGDHSGLAIVIGNRAYVVVAGAYDGQLDSCREYAEQSQCECIDEIVNAIQGGIKRVSSGRSIDLKCDVYGSIIGCSM